jgi:hypothetical protein
VPTSKRAPFLKKLWFYSDFIKETLAYCLSRGRATVPPVQITSEKTFFVAALEAHLKFVEKITKDL